MLPFTPDALGQSIARNFVFHTSDPGAYKSNPEETELEFHSSYQEETKRKRRIIDNVFGIHDFH